MYELLIEQELVAGCGRGVNDRRYFATREAAIREGQHMANIYAAILDRPMVRHDVNRYDIVVAWEDEEREARVSVHQGELEA